MVWCDDTMIQNVRMCPQFLSSACEKRDAQLKGGTRPWQDGRRNCILEVSGLAIHTRARTDTLTLPPTVTRTLTVTLTLALTLPLFLTVSLTP